MISSSISSIFSNGTTANQVQVFVILLVVTLIVALISRRLRLPYTLLLVCVGLLIGFLPILSDVHLDPDSVLFLFLPILLFEGAWNVEIERLRADWLPIILFAVVGLGLSLALVAVVLHFGIGLEWLVAILLGAMVSPTDPVAVISLLRQLGMSDRLRTIVEGESLFNDGVGAAVFEIVLALLLSTLGLTASAEPSFIMIILDGLWLMCGGLLLGLIVGWGVARLLRLVDDYLIEITVTFSVAYGMYLVGVFFHTSGLLAVVGAGLVMGSYGRQTGMSARTREVAHNVWEFIAYLANSLIFLLLGIQIGETNLLHAMSGIAWAIIGVVIGRILMVYLLVSLQDMFARRFPLRADRSPTLFPAPRPLPLSWRPLLILCGLRGALSVALVLSLPLAFPGRDLLTSIVYGVVLITLLGQGIGLRVLLPRWPKEESSVKASSTGE